MKQSNILVFEWNKQKKLPWFRIFDEWCEAFGRMDEYFNLLAKTNR